MAKLPPIGRKHTARTGVFVQPVQDTRQAGPGRSARLGVKAAAVPLQPDITIQAGQTYNLPTALASSTTLIASSGNNSYAGAVLQIAAGVTSTANGTILVQGGMPADNASSTAASGATLVNNGVFQVGGQITLGGGHGVVQGEAGSGALLLNNASLTNTGYIKIAGAYQSGAAHQGSGATLYNAGVLTNNGTLELASSGNTAGTGASLIDTGVLTNNGVLGIAGNATGVALTVAATGLLNNTQSIRLYSSNTDPGGASVTIDGTLDNSGTIASYGDQNTRLSAGATLIDNGVMNNTGLISITPLLDFGIGYSLPSTLILNGVLSNAGNLFLGSVLYNVEQGQLTIAASGTLLNSGNISGSGNLVNHGLLNGVGTARDTISAYITNDGTIVSGASMQISGGIITDPGASGQIEISAGGFLNLDAGTDAAQIITFDSASGRLNLDYSSNNDATIDDLVHGDLLDLASLRFFAGDMSENFGDGVLTVSNGIMTDQLLLDGITAGSRFSLVSDGNGGTLVEEVAQCYLPGTRLRTEHGDRAIEHLRIGDRLATLHAGLQPITWIGHRSYDGRFIAGNHLMLPVCIKAGALAPGIPARDLHVSPGHGVYLEGALVPAWRLVNNVAILQYAAVDRVTYIHVELAEHEIIFAENLPAESYLDEGCRGQFVNAHEFAALYPHRATQPRPTPCVSRIDDGFQLQSIQRTLALRAGQTPTNPAPSGLLRGYLEVAGPDRLIGWAQDTAHPEHPVCLDAIVDGRRVLRLLANRYRADVRAAGLGSGCHGFDLPLPAPIHGAIELRRATDSAVLARAAALAAAA